MPGIDKRNQFAFIGNVKRIKPQEFTYACNRIFQRNLFFVDLDPDSGFAGDFVQSGTDTTAGRVP